MRSLVRPPAILLRDSVVCRGIVLHVAHDRILARYLLRVLARGKGALRLTDSWIALQVVRPDLVFNQLFVPAHWNLQRSNARGLCWLTQ